MNPNKIFEPITKNEDFKHAHKIFRDIGLSLIFWIFGVLVAGLVASWILAFGR